jgi:hypothetical protein
MHADEESPTAKRDCDFCAREAAEARRKAAEAESLNRADAGSTDARLQAEQGNEPEPNSIKTPGGVSAGEMEEKTCQ